MSKEKNDPDYFCEKCHREQVETTRWMWEGVEARICFFCEDEGAVDELKLMPLGDDMKRCRNCNEIKRIPKKKSSGPRVERSEFYCKECVYLPKVRMSPEGYERYLRCLRGEEKLYPEEEDHIVNERREKYLENLRKGIVME